VILTRRRATTAPPSRAGRRRRRRPGPGASLRLDPDLLGRKASWESGPRRREGGRERSRTESQGQRRRFVSSSVHRRGRPRGAGRSARGARHLRGDVRQPVPFSRSVSRERTPPVSAVDTARRRRASSGGAGSGRSAGSRSDESSRNWIPRRDPGGSERSLNGTKGRDDDRMRSLAAGEAGSSSLTRRTAAEPAVDRQSSPFMKPKRRGGVFLLLLRAAPHREILKLREKIAEGNARDPGPRTARSTGGSGRRREVGRGVEALSSKMTSALPPRLRRPQDPRRQRRSRKSSASGWTDRAGRGRPGLRAERESLGDGPSIRPRRSRSGLRAGALRGKPSGPRSGARGRNGTARVRPAPPLSGDGVAFARRDVSGHVLGEGHADPLRSLLIVSCLSCGHRPAP